MAFRNESHVLYQQYGLNYNSPSVSVNIPFLLPSSNIQVLYQMKTFLIKHPNYMELFCIFITNNL